MKMRLDASDFTLALNGQLSKWRAGVGEAVVRANRGALEATSDFAKRTLRADLREAGLGALEKTWQTDIYPRKGLAYEPALRIYSKAEVIVSAFDEGPTIKPTGDGMLAIPIPGGFAEDFPNPKGPDDKVDYARRKFGDRLFVIPANGNRPAILAAELVGVSKGGRLGPRKKTKTGKFTKGTQTAMLFYLVPQARLPKLLDIRRDFRRIEKFLIEEYPRALKRELREVGIL
jgi:hypothetical protein